MPVLSEWLHPVRVSDFVSTHLGRRPLARPSCAGSAIEYCNWDTLDAVLRAAPSDILVVSRSKLIDLPAPRTRTELRDLFCLGAGLAIHAPERVSSQLEMLAGEFALDLPGDQRIILFATPARTNGFGWHYDAEDVFIVQTAGDKEYFLRHNTVTPAPERGFRSDFRDYRKESSPLLSCRLLPGDLLYIPKGTWHMAIAHEDSLSVSIGVFPSAGIDCTADRPTVVQRPARLARRKA
jgi:50S ribosomal protein L16 3-hydroxylase